MASWVLFLVTERGVLCPAAKRCRGGHNVHQNQLRVVQALLERSKYSRCHFHQFLSGFFGNYLCFHAVSHLLLSPRALRGGNLWRFLPSHSQRCQSAQPSSSREHRWPLWLIPLGCRLACNLGFPLKNSAASLQKVMKSPTGGAASPTSGWAPSLPPRAAAAVPRAWRAPVPPRAQLPGVLTLPRPLWPIQLGFGRSSGRLVLSCTSASKEGAEEAWLGAGEGQDLQPKVPRGSVSSPPVQCGRDQFGRLQQ